MDRDKTVIVCVGVGGVFYHGIPAMTTFCQRRDKARVVLVDDDVVESKNRTRQWGFGEGEKKVQVAARTLRSLLGVLQGGIVGPMECMPIEGRVREGIDLSMLINVQLLHQEVKQVLVIASPDNHMARMAVHKGCSIVALQHLGIPIYEIVAGNDLGGGYAFGCVYKTRELKFDGETYDICEGDWTQRHYDIVEEAEKEKARLAAPQSCGALQEEVVGQTAMTNGLTAQCIWMMAEALVTGNCVGEVYWHHIAEAEHQPKKIEVIARLKERKIR